MMQNKFLFGITGGSGCGKTTISDIFRSCGYCIIDCDEISREITCRGSRCLEELEEHFGDKILFPDGSLNRKKLGKTVFSSSRELAILNDITHKYILEEVYKRAEETQSEIVGIDGALLIESGISKKCGYMIAVLADKDIRIQRIVNRDNLTISEAKSRINSQKVDNFYIENCDCILYNNRNKENAQEQVKEVVLKLEEKRKKDAAS